MNEETWRPLGVESDEEIAEYDALHDGVPGWMSAVFWQWVRDCISRIRRDPRSDYRTTHLDEELFEKLAQDLRITIANLRFSGIDYSAGQKQLNNAMRYLYEYPHPIRVADYLLAKTNGKASAELEALLERSKSAWKVGVRSGKPGLVRRVPLGVQVGADSVMQRAGRAGARLAKAWEELYGTNPNPSGAYGLAIKAVEDAAIPVVSPKNTAATLGTVLGQMTDQKNWRLPMTREHKEAPSSAVVVGMMRLLWHGQHDRHGGQPSAPGNVSFEEATVAVSIATTLVQLFSAGLLARSESPSGEV